MISSISTPISEVSLKLSSGSRRSSAYAIVPAASPLAETSRWPPSS